VAEVLLGDVPARNAARLGADRWALRHGDAVLSWGELAERALRRAHALTGQGVSQGDRVVLALPNANALYEWTFALWKLGATPTVVSPRLPATELEAIVALAEPRAVVAADPALQAALGALPEHFGRDHADGSPLASKEAPHWKAMTSGGSTGRPKGVMLSQDRCLPVLGRVSMDMTIIDLSATPDLREGDWVEVEYEPVAAAAQSGLSQYELFTLLGARFGR